MKVKIKKIENGELPIYKREGDVCMDCFARSPVLIQSFNRCLVPLGFALELPIGYEAVVRPRSGMSKESVDVCVGTIDANYRGEVMACVVNNTEEVLHISQGQRICQLAVREAPAIEWDVVDELSETERGDNGFGSSGVN